MAYTNFSLYDLRSNFGIKDQAIKLFSNIALIMKTQSYNPSPLEVSFAQAIAALQEQIAQKLPNLDLVALQSDTAVDNPVLRFHLQDSDGDRHEIVVQVIQRIDDAEEQ